MQDKPSSPEVPLEKLRWRCDPESFPFDTTADFPPFEGIIGQERAQKALALGVEIARAESGHFATIWAGNLSTGH